MPKVAYSQQDRDKIRQSLIVAGLELMARQGIQHTTVEQIYSAVGISRTFFYTFFPTKEDFVVETLYYQQPKILAFAKELMDDPSLSWREAVCRFFHACCNGARSGIAVLTMQEQQQIFRRLTPQGYQQFRTKQALLFSGILECFGIVPNKQRIDLFTNVSLTILIVRRAIPEALPFFVPQAADETLEFQINALVDWLATLRN